MKSLPQGTRGVVVSRIGFLLKPFIGRLRHAGYHVKDDEVKLILGAVLEYAARTEDGEIITTRAVFPFKPTDLVIGRVTWFTDEARMEDYDIFYGIVDEFIQDLVVYWKTTGVIHTYVAENLQFFKNQSNDTIHFIY